MPSRSSALVKTIQDDVKTMIRIKNQVKSLQNSRKKLPDRVRAKVKNLHVALESLQESYMNHARSSLEKKLTRVYKNTLAKTRKRTVRR